MHCRRGMLKQCLIFEQFEMLGFRGNAILIAFQPACIGFMRILKGREFAHQCVPALGLVYTIPTSIFCFSIKLLGSYKDLNTNT